METVPVEIADGQLDITFTANVENRRSTALKSSPALNAGREPERRSMKLKSQLGLARAPHHVCLVITGNGCGTRAGKFTGAIRWSRRYRSAEAHGLCHDASNQEYTLTSRRNEHVVRARPIPFRVEAVEG